MSRDTDQSPRRHAPFRPLAAAAIGLTLMAPALLALLLWRHSVDVPHVDEWVFAPLLEKAARGDLAPRDFLEQYNEHRMVVTRAFILAFARTAGWNQRWQAAVAPVLAGATLLLIALIGRRAVLHAGSASRLAVLLTSWLLFSPVQDENWMLGMQLGFFVPGCCLTAVAALAASRWPWWTRWPGSAAMAVVSTFSVANGLLIWALALPPLWWPPDSSRERGRWAGLAVWTSIAAACAWLYFSDYQHFGRLPAWSSPLTEPWPFWRYAAMAIGGPFAAGTALPPTSVAVWCGGLLIAAFLGFAASSCLVPRLRRRALPFVVLGAYALVSAMAVALARAALGDSVLPPGRYATFVLPLPIATVWLVALWWDDLAGRRVVPSLRALTATVGVGTVLLTLLSLSSLVAIDRIRESSRALLAGRAALPFLEFVRGPQIYAPLNPWGGLRPAADTLWRLGLLRPPRRPSPVLPAQGDTAKPEAGSGRLEQGGPGGNGLLVVEGWAVNVARRSPADLVVITAGLPDGRSMALAFARVDPSRPLGYLGTGADVRRRAGWRAEIPAADLPAGATHLSAWGLDGRTGRAFRLAGTYALGGGS